MGYYMTFITMDRRKVNLRDLRNHLKKTGDKYRVVWEGGEGLLYYAEKPYCRIEVVYRGKKGWKEQAETMDECLELCNGMAKPRVERLLRDAQAMVVLQVHWGDRDLDSTLDRIYPVVDWLHANRTGLLRADNEGFWNEKKIVLRETD
ncbi:MAG TPA: hypothetical protein VI893_07210 [Thermoplasmata archaeon]|nr:hypothetical protein [Thermoplasmata archaeon]